MKRKRIIKGRKITAQNAGQEKKHWEQRGLVLQLQLSGKGTACRAQQILPRKGWHWVSSHKVVPNAKIFQNCSTVSLLDTKNKIPSCPSTFFFPLGPSHDSWCLALMPRVSGPLFQHCGPAPCSIKLLLLLLQLLNSLIILLKAEEIHKLEWISMCFHHCSKGEQNTWPPNMPFWHEEYFDQDPADWKETYHLSPNYLKDRGLDLKESYYQR